MECSRCGLEKPLKDFGFYWDHGTRRQRKTCKICKREKEREYERNNSERIKKRKRAYYLKNHKKIRAQVKQWRKDNSEKELKRQRKRAFKKKYGITIEEYDEILKRQNGICAICGNVPSRKRLSVDHDHKTGKIRGLLCQRCNLTLGLFNDSAEILHKLALYLEKY